LTITSLNPDFFGWKWHSSSSGKASLIISQNISSHALLHFVSTGQWYMRLTGKSQVTMTPKNYRLHQLTATTWCHHAVDVSCTAQHRQWLDVVMDGKNCSWGGASWFQ
jgi:cytidylate kinase